MIGRFPAPVFRSEPRSDFIVEAIATQRRCFDHATRILKNRSLDQIQTLSDQSLEALCRELYAGLSNQAIVRQIFQQQHFAEDVSVLSALGCI